LGVEDIEGAIKKRQENGRGNNQGKNSDGGVWLRQPISKDPEGNIIGPLAENISMRK